LGEAFREPYSQEDTALLENVWRVPWRFFLMLGTPFNPGGLWKKCPAVRERVTTRRRDAKRKHSAGVGGRLPQIFGRRSRWEKRLEGPTQRHGKVITRLDMSLNRDVGCEV